MISTQATDSHPLRAIALVAMLILAPIAGVGINFATVTAAADASSPAASTVQNTNAKVVDDFDDGMPNEQDFNDDKNDVTLSDTSAGQLTFTAPEISGSETLMLTVDTKDSQAITTDEVDVTVQDTSTKPGSSPIAVDNATVDVGNTTTANVTLVVAPDGLAGYTLTVGLEDGSIGKITDVTIPDAYNLTGPTEIAPGNDTAHIQATDLNNQTVPGDTNVTLALLTIEGTASGTTNISVLDVDPSTAGEGGSLLNTTVSAGTLTVTGNSAPTADAGPDQTVDEETTVTLDASGSSDLDSGDTLSYTWTQMDGTNVALSDSSAAQPTFTAPEVTFSETLTFEVEVSDGQTSSTDTVNITVQNTDESVVDDFDGDGTLNENDPDDDNDGVTDDVDPFAIDPDNGTTTTLPVELTFEPNSRPNTILGVGFTGLMNNGTDYQEMYDLNDVTVDGALSLQVPEDGGTVGSTQRAAFQLGIDPPDQKFAINTTVNGLPQNPEGAQQMGLQFGVGNQDKYVKLVVNGNGGDSVIEFSKQNGEGLDNFERGDIDEPAVVGPETKTELSLVVDPSTNTAEGYYRVDGGDWTSTGVTHQIPDSWLDASDGTGPAVGILSTSVQASFTFTATWENLTVETLGADPSAPTADAGPDQTVDEGTEVTLDASGSSDPDGDTLTYSWTQAGGPSVSLQANETVSPSFTAPEVTFSKTLTFEVEVSDGQTSSTDTVNVTVQDTDESVVNDFDGDGTPNENDPDDDNDGVTDDVDPYAIDPDNGTTTNLPVNLEFQPNSRPNTILGVGFTGLMNNGTDYQEMYDLNDVTVDGALSLRVPEDGGTVGSTQRAAFQLGIDPPDQKFAINTTVSGLPQNPAGAQQMGLQFGVGDQDEYMKLVVNGNQGNDDGGIEFSKQNGEGFDSFERGFTAEPAVVGPETETELSIVIDPSTNTAEGYYRVNGGDWKSTGITHQIPESWLDSSDGTGPAVGILSTSVQASFTFTATWENLTVETLGDSNSAPTADAGPDQTVDEGTEVTLDASGSSDPDGDTLTYSWTVVDDAGTDVSLSDTSAAQPTFTAPEVTFSETLTFEVEVSDGQNSSTDTVNVTVRDTDESVVDDFDGDGTPNENDSDDDNDGVTDDVDPYAIDPDNGTTTTLPVELTFEPNSRPGTLLGVGFTGLMNNGTDYQEMYDLNDVTVDGSLSLKVPEDGGTVGSTQRAAFQLGIDPSDQKFAINTTVSGLPQNPEDFQQMGLQFGVGDQDEYMKLVVQANGGSGGVEFSKQDGDFTNFFTAPESDVLGPETETELSIVIDPSTNTAEGYYRVDGRSWISTGQTYTVPNSWLDASDGTGPAVGILSTSVQASFTFTATWENLTVETLGADTSALTADAGPDQTVDEGTTVTLDASGSSVPDGDTLTYNWTQAGGPSVSLSDNSTQQPTFTAPEVTFSKTLTFEVEVSDGQTSSTDTVNVTVRDTDASVVDDFDGDGTPNENDSDDDNDGVTDDVDPFAIDPNNGTTTNLPVNLEFQPNSRPNTILGVGFTGLMNNGTDYQEMYDLNDVTVDGALSLRVPEDGGTVGSTQRAAFQLGIDPPDQKFAINTTVSGLPQNPEGAQQMGLQFGVGDQDEYVKLVVNANGGDSVIEFSKQDSGGFERGDIAEPAVVGPETKTELSLVVDPSNNTAEGYYRVDGGDWKSTEVTHQIPDSWLDASDGTGPAVGILSTSVQASFTFTATWENLTVETLGDSNSAPTADAGPDQIVDEGTEVTLDASGSSDPDGDSLTYMWSVSDDGGTGVSLSDTSAAQPSFTAPTISEEMTLSFGVEASDGELTDTDTINVTVQPVNDPPMANAGNDQSVEEGDTVTLNASGSADPDGDTLTYNWTQTKGPSVLLSDASAVQPTFTAPTEVTDPTTLTFEIEVSDDQTNDTDTVNVSVQPVNIPSNASFDYSPVSPTSGEEITFNASGLNQSDGAVQTYAWDFNDDGQTDKNGAEVSWSFSETGVYNITLKVTDDDGFTTTIRQQVTVVKTVPQAVASQNGSADTINLKDIQKAIDWWATGEMVPETGGETISMKEVQKLINMWAIGASVNEDK